MEEKNNIIAILDEEDQKELERYRERKNSLEELKTILNSNTKKVLLDKVEEDIKVMDNTISQWLSKIKNKYNLAIANKEDVYIDIYTGEIILKSTK
ncbi:hypothetical protein [Clostridium sp.]|uniref:hypothetical protein n=1 Tax=Clostridium sp. TaxID=1506 RepID=UPI003217E70F